MCSIAEPTSPGTSNSRLMWGLGCEVLVSSSQSGVMNAAIQSFGPIRSVMFLLRHVLANGRSRQPPRRPAGSLCTISARNHSGTRPTPGARLHTRNAPSIGWVRAAAMMKPRPGDEPYPPIADYGLLSDMHSCALVSRAGSIDWCCFPRFDSPAVFARLLDWANGGYFQVAPLRLRSVHRRYLPETNLLETTFETADGAATLTDFMPVHPHSRPEQPREVGTRQQIIRMFECT